MQSDLRVLNLYNNANQSKLTKFRASLQSKYSLASNYEKVEADFTWLDLMEDTIMYLDNILRNPNRFIVNEEEVVKVEQARRITVESIKHLSKHTNFIQEIDKDGDVRPSKILNINKDESYNTYENRLIYTLIGNMRMYIDMKERSMVASSRLKDNKVCEYTAASKIGAEKINISMQISAKTNYDKEDGIRNGMTAAQRLDRLKLRISDLTNTQVYVSLAKEHVARVIPPIKKTNLILKNVNFQYAMKLWDFLKAYRDDEELKTKKSTTYKDDKIVQGMFDDTFLLNYLLVSNIGNENRIKKFSKEEVERMTDNLITKIVELNADLKMTDLQQIIGAKIAVIRNKKEASLSEIENKFNSKLQGVIDKILSFNFR
jgi:hypothetical protein